MPGRITELSESQIIADILREQRSHRTNAVAQQPIWEYQEWTSAGVYALSYLPYGINCVALNGLVLRDGTDYTVNYTTGVITLTPTFTTGDVLSVSYVTNGDLVAASAAVDTGLPPTFRSRTVTGGPAGTTDPTITLPSDVAAGDLLILAWASYYVPGGDPTGWTRALLTTATGGGNPAGVGCWYKTATGADASAVVHIPLGVASDYWTLAAAAYQNCSGVRAVTTSASSAGTSTYSTPTGTATANDTSVSVWCHEGGSSGGLSGFTLDAAVTERVRNDWGGVINQFSHVGIGDETALAGGTTAARTATWAGGSSSWASMTFILKP